VTKLAQKLKLAQKAVTGNTYSQSADLGTGECETVQLLLAAAKVSPEGRRREIEDRVLMCSCS
jgi:hypothetical protein